MSTAPDYPCDAYGWLSPSGEYHEVEEAGGHLQFFDDMDMSARASEDNGWIHLCEGNYQHCGVGLCSHLTPEQRHWLVRVGFDLYKGDEE